MLKRIATLILIMLCTLPALAQKSPEGDLFGGFSFLSVDTNGLTSRLRAYGWEVAPSLNFYKHLAIEGDFSGHYYNLNIFGTSYLVADHSFAGGPRVNFGPVFIHSLFGGDILASQGASQGGFVLLEGGGVQIPVSTHWAARVSADYGLSRHNVVFANPRYDQNNFRVAAGIVYHFGGNGEPSAHPAAPSPTAPLNPNYSGPRVTLADIGLSGTWNSYGYFVRTVAPDSPAQKAGIAVGDTVVSINGHLVQNEESGTAALSQAGATADVGITKATWASNQISVLHLNVPSR